MNKLKKIFNELSKAIAGDGESSFLTLVCLFANGHLLIEDVPGVGKTLLASTLAKSCNVDYKRVQCTPDIMPGDILGFSMYDINTGISRYMKGPVMTNLLLVDEINRASPKTQSALLEVMQENEVTVDGTVHDVPTPFMVIATQNPIESVGTSSLPEAQLDRFTMRISMGYPDIDNEMLILSRYGDPESAPVISPVLDTGEILQIRKEVSGVHIENSIMKYIINITTKTRNHHKISLGCSPRASLALMQCAKARAFLMDRKYVIPDDVKTLAEKVLSHRIILSTQLKGVQKSAYSRSLIREITEQITL